MNSDRPVFRILKSRYYEHRVPVVGLDYYNPRSRGEDDFSRKQIWFYTYGDEEIAEEFREPLVEIFDTIFSDMEWDLMTLYPTHAKGEVNPYLRNLFMDVASEAGIPFEQVIERNKSVQESHDLEDEKAKVVNLEGSLDVKRDLEGQNVILVDNIALSGISLLHGANELIKHGAENVFAVALGLSTEEKEDTMILDEGITASQLIQRVKEERVEV